MAEAGPAIALRPATAGDWPRLRAWARQPDIQAWLGPQSAIEAEFTLAMASPSSLCRIIEADGAPIGYAQAVDAGLWSDGAADLPPGAYDVDILIASPEHRGRGCGSQAVRLLVDEVFSTTLAPAVSVTASIRNERAVRAYEKAGFRWSRIRTDPALGPVWLMVRERP